jgi:hypothetical protein
MLDTRTGDWEDVGSEDRRLGRCKNTRTGGWEDVGYEDRRLVGC